MTSENFKSRPRRVYEHPPIQEVLIQASLGAYAPNAATPGQLFERLRREYPLDIETQAPVIQLPPGSEIVGQFPAVGPVRYLFRNEEKNRFVILADDKLSANTVPPYEGWDELLARFMRAACALLDARPEVQITELSVRYINRVVIPESPINTDDYFTIPVRTAEEGTAPFSGFALQVQSVLTDDPVTCSTGFFTAGQDGNDLVYRIDLELTRPVPASLARDSEAWLPLLQDLHLRENAEFESIVTDRCRRLFDNGK